MFKDENGNTHKAMLSKRMGSEIIVSSGAIGSPHLLLLSGIGPKAELERFKIPVVLDNEFVGKGMADNPMNTIFVPSKTPVKQSLIQTVGITKLGVYIEASSGFGQSTNSIHCDHGIASAEVSYILHNIDIMLIFLLLKSFRRNVYFLACTFNIFLILLPVFIF